MKKYISLCALSFACFSIATTCTASPPKLTETRQRYTAKEKIVVIETATPVVEMAYLVPTYSLSAYVLEAPAVNVGIHANIETGTVALKAKTTVAASSDGYCYRRPRTASINFIIAATSGHRILHIDPGLIV